MSIVCSAGSTIADIAPQYELIHRSFDEQPYLGLTADDRYSFRSFEDSANRDDQFIIRNNLFGDEDPSFRIIQIPENVSIHPSWMTFSDDGRYLVWLVREPINNGLLLSVHDFSTEETVENLLTLGEQYELSTPTFLPGSHRLALTAVVVDEFRIQLDQSGMLLLNLEDLSNELIELSRIEDIQGQERITSYTAKIDNQGQHIVFRTFSFDSRIERMIHHDLNTQQNTLIYESVEPQPFSHLFQLSTDGKSIAYTSFAEPDRWELVVRNVDIPLAQRHVLPSPFYILAANDDLTRVLLNGSGDYGDGLNDYGRGQLSGVSEVRITNESRFIPLLVMDLVDGRMTVMNRINHFQITDFRPFDFSGDGQSVLAEVVLNGFPSRGNALVRQQIELDYQPDASVSGLWYQRNAPGQGVSLHVVPDPTNRTGKLVLLWTTLDHDGTPLWVYMEGYFDQGAVTGQAFTTEATGQNPDGTAQRTEIIGQLTIRFDSCREAELDYSINRLAVPSGTISLNRLAYQQGIGCL